MVTLYRYPESLSNIETTGYGRCVDHAYDINILIAMRYDTKLCVQGDIHLRGAICPNLRVGIQGVLLERRAQTSTTDTTRTAALLRTVNRPPARVEVQFDVKFDARGSVAPF